VTRVGLVVHGQPPELVGGTEGLVARLASDLAATGRSVEVFSGSIEWRPQFEVVRHTDGPVPVTRVHRSDLFFERWDKLECPRVERAFRQWLDDFRPDLVHVHHWARLSTNLVAVASDHGVPAVVTLHDLFSSCPRYHRVKADDSFCTERPSPDACRHCAPRWRFQGDDELDASLSMFVGDLRAEVSHAAAVLAPTAGHGRRVMDWLGIDKPVIALPPAASGVPAAATRPLGDGVASAETPLRVGAFGHLHPLKGALVLLDAQAALPDPSRVEVHLWGAAPDAESEALVVAHAGDRRVVRHGAYTPADLAHAPVDVAVLPSLCAESYAFTLDEAADLGVPLVASDLGAHADRATARMALVPRGDAGALAQQLLALADDPARRKAMAGAPPPATCDAQAHLDGLLEVYAQVASRPRPPRLPLDRVALARREHAALLREAGLAELLRSEGWEDVVADLQARLAQQGGAAPDAGT
jgi:glycosyltransferase involved in cell wall biosynthesis